MASSSAWRGKLGAMHGSAMTGLSVRQQPSTHPCNGTAENQTPGSPPLQRTLALRGHHQTLRLPPGRSQPSPQRLAYAGIAATATAQCAALPTSALCARAHSIAPRIAPSCNPIHPIARLPPLLGQTRTASSSYPSCYTRLQTLARNGLVLYT